MDACTCIHRRYSSSIDHDACFVHDSIRIRGTRQKFMEFHYSVQPGHFPTFVSTYTDILEHTHTQTHTHTYTHTHTHKGRKRERERERKEHKQGIIPLSPVFVVGTSKCPALARPSSSQLVLCPNVSSDVVQEPVSIFIDHSYVSSHIPES